MCSSDLWALAPRLKNSSPVYVWATRPPAISSTWSTSPRRKYRRVLGGLIAWTSTQGRRLLAFLRESWQETRRVVWPTKKETWSVTLYVFLFVVVMAIFLWLVDSGLQFVLYDLVLGWSR